MKILLADAFDESLPGRLASFGEVTPDLQRLADADVLLVRSKTKVDRALLDRARGLKLVIRGGVGLDNVDLPACRERGIDVRNTPRASSVAVAELAMALMLAGPSRLLEGHDGIQQGRWLKKELKRTELQFAARSLLNLRSLLRARSGRVDDTERSPKRVPPPPGSDADARARFFQFELFKRLLSMELKRAKRYGFPLFAKVTPVGGDALEVTMTEHWLRAGSQDEHLLAATAIYQMWKNHQNSAPVRVTMLDPQGRRYITIDETGAPSLLTVAAD